MGYLVGLPSVLVLVSAALLGVGLTLLRQAVRGGALPGCGGADGDGQADGNGAADAGCGAVTRGRWARLGLVPVALPGAGAYAVVLASAVAVHPAVRAALPDGLAAAAWAVLLTAAFAAAGAGLWFAFLQAAVIRQFCAYCMMAHGLALAAAGLAAVNARDAGVAWAEPLACAGALVVAFAVAQCLIRPKLYSVTAVIPVASIEPAGVDSAPSSEGSESADLVGVDIDRRGRELARPGGQMRGLPPAATKDAGKDAGTHNYLHDDEVGRAPDSQARRVTLAGGNVTLVASDWPTLGPPDAKHLLALLADPTCKACRQMHRTAADAVRLAGGWLAVLYVPVPMDPACNPAAAGRKARARTDVCEYARLVLSVHAAAPAAYPALERWLLAQPDPPPPIDVARRRATELAPAEAAAWADAVARPGVTGVVDRKVASAVAAYRAARLTQVPALLLPAAAIGGQLPSPQKLLDLLGRELAKPAGAGTTIANAPAAVVAQPKASPARGGNPFAGGATIGDS